MSWSVGIAVWLGIAGSWAAQDSCPVYLLVRSEDGFEIRRELVAAGQTRAYRPGTDVVTLVLPWSEGQSGEVVQANAPPAAYAVRCADGTMRVTVQRQGAEPRLLPEVAVTSLSRFRMRVSATPESGPPEVFVIHPDGVVERDTGPPLDMFRGLVPLQAGDVSVTTETRRVERLEAAGIVPLRWAGPYLVARLSVPGGGTGDVIVDLGASRTLLSADMLPPGITPKDLVAAEYGPEGRRERSVSMGALSAGVDQVKTARLESVQLGPVSVNDLPVYVLPSLPPIAGLELKGIVGLDLLQRSRVVVIETGPLGARLSLGESMGGQSAIDAPFALVSGLIVVQGIVAGDTVPFVLDTGARSTLLSEAVARRLGLAALPGAADTFRGLDGAPVQTWGAVLPTLRLGNGVLEQLRVNVGVLPILDRMGFAAGGLLGQNLWERFERIELDWEAGHVRFYAKRGA